MLPVYIMFMAFGAFLAAIANKFMTHKPVAVHGTVVLVGITGSGKSTLGNNLLMHNAFPVSRDILPETRKTAKGYVDDSTVNVMTTSFFGTKEYLALTVFDTVGLFDGRDETEHTRERQALKAELDAIPGKKVFLYVFDSNTVRVKEADESGIATIKKELVGLNDDFIIVTNRASSDIVQMTAMKVGLQLTWDRVKDENKELSREKAWCQQLRGSDFVSGQLGKLYYYKDYKDLLDLIHARLRAV